MVGDVVAEQRRRGSCYGTDSRHVAGETGSGYRSSQIFTWILRLVIILGCYVPDLDSRPLGCRRFIMKLSYFVFVTLFNVFHTVRYGFLFAYEQRRESDLFRHIMIFIFQGSVLLLQMGLSLTTKHLSSFFDQLDTLPDNDIEHYYHRTKRHVNTTTIIIICQIMLNLTWITSCVAYFCQDEILEEIGVPFLREQFGFQVTIALDVTHSVYRYGTWVSSMALFGFISNVIYKECVHFSDMIKQETKSRTPLSIPRIAQLRLKHVKICSLLSRTNDIFSMAIGLILVTSIGALGLTLYTAANSGSQAFTIFASMMLIWQIVVLAFVCVTSALLSDAVGNISF